MTTKTIKIILFVSLIVAMIIPFSMMDVSAALDVNANNKAIENSNKGKLYIKDKNDMKNLSQDEFVQLQKSIHGLSESKHLEIKKQIDNIAKQTEKIEELENIWITSIGADHENGSVEVSVERSGLNEGKINTLEKRLRNILGNDVDITISYSDPLNFAT